MSQITAGKLRRRIRIEAPANTKDKRGGEKIVWSLVPGCDSVPAKIVYAPPAKKGDEEFKQQQNQSSVFITVTIRYRPSTNIDASMRVVYGTRNFNIRTVLPVDEDQKEISLQCEEIQAKGTLHS